MSSYDQLVERGRAARQSGNRLAARGYLRRAARIAPDRLDIWQQLCHVSDRTPDRIECLTRIVELDPSNNGARQELDRLRRELEAEKAEQEAAPTAPELSAQATADEATLQPLPVGIRLDVTDEMRQEWSRAVAAGEPLYCINHPQRETVLRCNRCGAPVCNDCVVHTPVGFRCKQCVQAQQAGFYNARWYDWILAAIISLVLSTPAAFVIAFLRSWWFALILSPIVGSLIGGAVHWAVGRRRGRHTWWVAAVCIVMGTLPSLVGTLNLLSVGIYAVAATTAAIGILKLGRSR